MRLARLDLLAFGPFTEVTLDLAVDSGSDGLGLQPGLHSGLHVVHGGNAAGKSTTLRALEGLLFGIPERTGDAHTHALNKLRVGARLVAASGETLDFVRRKGRRNTLLDAAGEPLDDAVLAAMLQGVGPERFRTVFALDAERLRQGAQALLAGGGDVGESLFDAAGGGLAIHTLLTELEREADELYTPQARKRSLNEALAAFRAARQRQGRAGLGADAWRQQLAEIESCRTRRDELLAQRHETLAEQSRLGRIRRVLPLLARRDEAARVLAELGTVTDLPEQARAERMEVQSVHETTSRDLRRVEAELAKNEAEQQALCLPVSLLALPDTQIEALQDDLGRQRSAAADLPKRRAELAALQADVLDLLRRLGRTEADPESLRVDVARQATIRKLAAEGRGLEARHEVALEDLAEDEARRALLGAEAARAGEPLDVAALAALLSSARPLSEAAQEFEDNGGTFDRLKDDVEARRVALQLERTSFASIERMPVPTEESLQRFEQEYRELQAEVQRLAERTDDLDRRRAATQRGLATEAAAGDVPTEAQLADARAERDRQWEALRVAGEITDEPAEAFGATLAAADDVGDRLRRDADRVARHAELVGRGLAESAEVKSATAARKVLSQRRSEHESAWAALWEPCGVTPGPPTDMRGWQRRFEALREAVGRHLEAELDRQQLEGNVQDVGRQLMSLLVSAGQEVADPATLPTLVAQAEALLELVAEDTEEQRRRFGEMSAVDERLEQKRRPRASRAGQALEQWQRSWAKSVAALDLPGDADPTQAEAVLDVLGDLFPKLDGAARLQRRIEGMERDGAAFAERIDELLAEHLPDVDVRSVEGRAEALVRRHRSSREDERRATRLASDQRELVEQRDRLAVAVEEAAQRLQRLLAAGGVADLAALVSVEQRAAEARTLREKLAAIDERILEEGAGSDVEVLRAEIRDVNIDDVNARLEEVKSQLAELDEQRDESVHELARLEAVRDRQSDDDAAADAAAEAEGHLARVRELSSRYLRLRVAALVVRTEVERYREENQGPILRRAAELFPRLTCGRCTELKVGFGDGDHPVLLCVEADGSEKTVEQLSKGTADQLYLALRLASLEHHARRDEPMPLVLDDVLVQFDVPSARAALEVLGELTATTQVLLFTHHDHIVELAKVAVPPDRLVVHDLERRHPAGGTKARADHPV